MFCFFIALPLLRADESGCYFMNFYTPEQTGGHFQNWSSIQDDRGIMYFGNEYGILEYEGSTWRLIPNTNHSFAFSFAKDSTGRIWVGCAAELGYLAPDRKGDMQFVSLMDQIPVADRGFNYVWRVYALKEASCSRHVKECFFLCRFLLKKGRRIPYT